MNFKTTFILLVALVVVGVVAIIASRDGDKDKPDPATAGALFTISADDVKKVVVIPADGQKLVLERRGTDWRMLEPVDAAAESFQADALVRSIVELKSRGSRDTDKQTLASVGLEPPAYRVELHTDKTVHKLAMSGRSSVGDSVYVLPEGGAPRDVPASIAETLEKPASSYRRTRLLDVSTPAITQLRITKQDGSVLALQKNGAEWQVVEPQTMPADSTAISDLTFALTGLDAQEFVNPADVPMLAHPDKNKQTTVWFSTAPPSTQPTTQPSPGSGTTLTFGGYDSVLKKSVYLSVSNPATMAKVAATSLDSFQKKPLDLRDKRVADVVPEQVQRISIASNSNPTTKPTTRPAELVLERKKEDLTLGPAVPATRPTTLASTQPTTAPTSMAAAMQPALPSTTWAIASSNNADASEAQVKKLLAKFNPLRADRYITGPSPATQPTAEHVVTIVTNLAGKVTTHVFTFREQGLDKPVIGQYADLVFEAPRTLLADFTADFKNKPEAPEAPDFGENPQIPGLPNFRR